MSRRVVMTAVTSDGQMQSTLRETSEILSIVGQHLAQMRVAQREWAATLDALVLEHVLADHTGRSPMSDWPAAHELLDLTLAEALGHEHVSTTWPGE